MQFTAMTVHLEIDYLYVFMENYRKRCTD